MLQTLRLLPELCKSSILFLVAFSVLAGYALGHSLESAWVWSHFLKTLGGVCLLAAGSSALNQWQEKEQDQKMPRTARRPIPSGKLDPRLALAVSVLFLLLGGGILSSLKPSLGILGGLAFILYNGLYTLWWKPSWPYAAIPGALPGALPIFMGYVAAGPDLHQAEGWFLFSFLFVWQMPHFWTLALHYAKDYEKGGFPVLPVRYGPEWTIQNILIWFLAYLGLFFLSPLFLSTGPLAWLGLFLICAKLCQEMVRFYRRSSSVLPFPLKGLSFFLWINLSLILYLSCLVLDRWLWRSLIQ